jgi:hypothetical protein
MKIQRIFNKNWQNLLVDSKIYYKYNVTDMLYSTNYIILFYFHFILLFLKFREGPKINNIINYCLSQYVFVLNFLSLKFT